MNIIPFRGLELVTNIAEEENIAFLLDESGKKQLLCGYCNGHCFTVKVLIEAELEISISPAPLRQAIIHRRTPKRISAIKIVECAVCHSKEFVKETLPESEVERNATHAE